MLFIQDAEREELVPGVLFCVDVFYNLIGDDIKNVGGAGEREGFVWSFPVKLSLRVPSLGPWFSRSSAAAGFV